MKEWFQCLVMVMLVVLALAIPIGIVFAMWVFKSIPLVVLLCIVYVLYLATLWYLAENNI